MSQVKVGPKYQVVIPKAVRQKMRLHPGDTMNVRYDKGEVTMSLDPKAFLDKYAGILKGAYDEFGGAEAYLEAERASWDDEE